MHLLAGFLLLLNAYGDFKQNQPNTLFLVAQIASALLVLVFAASGAGMIRDEARGNGWFRLLEAAMFLYAARYFQTLHLMLPAVLQFIAAAGLLLLYISERKIFAPTYIALNEEGIIIPDNFKSAKIPWSAVQHVILRNDFLSIDTRDNRFLQYEVSEVLSDAVIDEVNAYCRSKFVTPA